MIVSMSFVCISKNLVTLLFDMLAFVFIFKFVSNYES